MSTADVEDAVTGAWSGSVAGYLIIPSAVRLMPAGEHAWICAACRRQHLHPSARVCTKCQALLRGDGVAVRRDEENYYAFLAFRSGAPFRLHAEELTGQTDRTEAQRRQARFQEVYLGDEVPRVDGIDMLSVTTTMEAVL